jgi:hypothetical protein
MAVPPSTDPQAMIGVLHAHARANMVVRTHADLVRSILFHLSGAAK